MGDATLQQFVKEVKGTSYARVEHDFGDGYVRLETSEAERRQAIQDIRSSEDIVLELLRNSRDAHASHIFIAFWREGDKRFITVIDDGEGIIPSMHAHIFEPRVTSKLDTSHIDKWGMHGRGMALYSVSVNAEDARVASSDRSLGCALCVKTDLSNLSEKADQSSFPTFTLTDTGTVSVRGPRNVLRCACEFAIEHRDSCSVYVGSPTEIAATLYEYGNATLSAIDRAFCSDPERLPCCRRLSVAPDPAGFAELAHSIGLELSPRSARRIMDGEIPSLEPLLAQITIEQPEEKKTVRKKKGAASQSRVRFSKDDLKAFSDSVRESYADLADKYYLDGDADISISSRHDALSITIRTIRREDI